MAFFFVSSWLKSATAPLKIEVKPSTKLITSLPAELQHLSSNCNEKKVTEPTSRDHYDGVADLDGPREGRRRVLMEIDEHPFDNGICQCFRGNWALACCCPGMMFGKIHHRLHHPEDPNLELYNHCCNGACWFWQAACGATCWWALCAGTFQRRELRQKLNLKGNACTDCLLHWFCCCCAMVQEEEELKNTINREILLAEKHPNHVYREKSQPGPRPEAGFEYKATPAS